MTKDRARLSGTETEAFSNRHHHFFRWRAGGRKAVKRAFAKRMRRKARMMLGKVMIGQGTTLHSSPSEGW